TYTVKKDPTDAHAGCGIWSSPAIDFETRRGYVGVSNPHNPESEHPNCNSVIEFGVDRSAPDFGTILRSFKGTPDDYIRGDFQQYPCLRLAFVPRPTPSQEVGTCTDMDLAIGAPPNLIRSADGRKMVGVGQKSGHYHLWDIETGERQWRSLLGIPTIIGGIVGGTAYDGQKIYGPSTVPGFVFAADKGTGRAMWMGQHSVVSYGNPTSTANGVVYTTTQGNYLNAYDAATGQQVLKRPLPPATDAAVGFQGTVGGVAIARNTVYAAVGNQSMPEGFIVALRPGAENDGTTGDDGEQPGGGGDDGGQPGPAGAYVLAGPGATSAGFPPAVMPKGASLALLNLDNAGHDVRSVDSGPDGQPLFRSEVSGFATPTPVKGAEKLSGARTYAFVCTIHPSMRGTLAVGP
ncbi:MAG: PQQ-binding-like beta-propeller repeat protein, partial [Acidimicrobiia bacterium]|nr:PQQ-binding-like beta-propeller repeat protein [Acidimicrobiia bacterium]